MMEYLTFIVLLCLGYMLTHDPPKAGQTVEPCPECRRALRRRR